MDAAVLLCSSLSFFFGVSGCILACGGQTLDGYAGSGLEGRLHEHRCKAAGNQGEGGNSDLSHRLQNKTGNLHANNL